MARIAGVNIHPNRQVGVGLTAIFGIGRSTAEKICVKVEIDPMTKMSDIPESAMSAIRHIIDEMQIEGDLRREISMNIKRKMDIKSYAGTRHRRGLPVNGQRTHTNARTRKNKRRR